MATSPEQLCGIPSNLCVLFGSIHSPALPIPRCIFSSFLKPLIVLPHQRRAWFLFCWENWSNAKKISNNIHYIYLTKWLLTYLIYLSVHLPTYLLSIHLSIHPSFYPSSVLFLPGTTDELSSLLSLAFSPHSMLALHFSVPLNDGFLAVGSTLHSPLHHQNFPSWTNPSTSRHAAVSPMSEWVSEWKSLSRVWLFATPWTIQSMEFSRPEYWSG